MGPKELLLPRFTKELPDQAIRLAISRGGQLDISIRNDGGGGGKCRLTQIHLEEDIGKMTPSEGGFSEIDLNFASIPLLEIVTEPEICGSRLPKGTAADLANLEVSDCEMQEGSLRCDGNVNLHVAINEHKIATPIVEIQNLNSFRSVEKALVYEVERQYQEWQQDGLKIKDALRRRVAGTTSTKSPNHSARRSRLPIIVIFRTRTWFRYR